MKAIYLVLLSMLPIISRSQTVNVSGQCISGMITLNKLGVVDGRPVFQGTGTVLGYSGITVSVYWIGAPDNVWVVDYEGQPYFMCPATTLFPPGTGSTLYTWVPVDGTECTGAAPLVINGSGILAVTLNGFAAREENKQVRLSWKTSSEINNKGFEIQRSANATDWSRIGFLDGKGSSAMETSYSFMDNAPLAGRNFYRLMQYDFDGTAAFSNIINVEIFRNGTYSLSNNPGNGVIRLNITSGTNVKIQVADMTGRTLMSRAITAGINQVDISKFASGTYILRIHIDGATFVERLLKQ